MALLGLSLIAASLVFLILRPPTWLPSWAVMWNRIFGGGSPQTPPDDKSRARREDVGVAASSRGDNGDKSAANGKALNGNHGTGLGANGAATRFSKETQARAAMPPPPVPSFSYQDAEEDSEEQTTPKAKPATPSAPIPSLSLTDHTSEPQPAAKPTAAKPPSSSSSLMAPPPLPRPPTLPSFPAANSAQRTRGGPIPNRGPPGGGGLAPPPTHSSAPSKPSRKVLLEPGHSPLDWARVSSSPTSDLRGVDPKTPFLRVPPSLLKTQNGRKGRDAWMALSGKVYNVQPYAKFHPGGVGELMRGAGKDGTRLFGEVHPWVNYETMLQACLVGLLVEEEAARGESEMDKMD